MADTKKLKKTVGKSAVRNTIQISAGDRIYYAIVNVLLGVFTIIVLMPLGNSIGFSTTCASRRPTSFVCRNINIGPISWAVKLKRYAIAGPIMIRYN